MHATDFAHAIFHQPNGKFPFRVGKKLCFTDEQLKTVQHALTEIINR